MRSVKTLAPLVAVLGRVGALDDLVAPTTEVGPVGTGYADEVGDDVHGDGSDELRDEFAVTPVEDGLEVLLAELSHERFDPHRLVVCDGRVDDLADLPVPGLGDLVDELLVLGNDDTRLTERCDERVDQLRRLEHVGLTRQEPPGVDPGDRTPTADLCEQLVRDLVAWRERVELDVDVSHVSPLDGDATCCRRA